MEDFVKKFLKALDEAEPTRATSSQNLFDQFLKPFHPKPIEVLNCLNKGKKTHNFHYDGVPVSTPEDFEK